MIAGVWANSNYDAQKEGAEGARKRILLEIEEMFENAISEIYTGKKAEPEIDWSDPFFAAIKSPRVSKPDEPPAESNTTQESAAEKARLLGEIDQG